MDAQQAKTEPTEAELEISSDEAGRLAAIIVPLLGTTEHKSDVIALALIRLAAGVAAEGERETVAWSVAEGAFPKTEAYSRAVGRFVAHGLGFKSADVLRAARPRKTAGE